MKTPGARGGRPRMNGHRETPKASAPPPAATPPAASPEKTRVLFVCIGNSCRSQMAEAFARAYGKDVIDAQSAGLGPAPIIAPLTKQVLAERNVGVGDQFPKGLDMMSRHPFDLVVDMSGTNVGLPGARTIAWTVRDPIGETVEVYRNVAHLIENLVMRLVLELRSHASAAKT